MSAEGHNNRTLLIAFAANLGIAISKFVAAAFTGSGGGAGRFLVGLAARALARWRGAMGHAALPR